MQEFRTVRELAIYLRDEMDKYLGRELPYKFKKEFLSYCKDSRYKRKIFKGEGFAPGFSVVMRSGRLELLKKVLEDEGFYND